MAKKLAKPPESNGAAPVGSSSHRKLVVNPAIREDSFDVTPENHRWLRVSWKLTSATLDRAVAAMGPDWHHSEPVLRVNRIRHDDSGPSAKERTDVIPIPTDISEWFVPVPAGAKFWQIELGYMAKNDKFFSLLHSAAVPMPGNPKDVRNASTVEEPIVSSSFNDDEDEIGLDIASELVVTGSVHPAAIVTVDDAEMIVDNRTGKFQWRTTLANGRFVVPIEAVTDRQRQRILLAVEANTHHLDTEQLGRR